ncbi:alpha/beta fold hydrolase [bacterium]|nr:alpha/beta fold hydrolase [bacterium]
MSQSSYNNTKIICSDGQTIAITIYNPKQTIKGAVFIAAATGIKRQFYANFASYLADNGYGVITFDYSGIGESLSGSIKNCKTSLQCWGERDMPAVLEQLKISFPLTKYHLIGHSAGGQLVGLMPNAMELSSLFNVACSSGYFKNMRMFFRLQAYLYLNFFAPISNALFGYTQSQWLGMGEPLPKAVAQQWSEWCNSKGYVKNAFGKTCFHQLYDQLSIPSLWVNAIDDDIANNENVADMLSVFTKLDAETLTLIPKEHSLKEIGHMKFFSRKSHILWPIALKWLNKI